MNNFEHRVPRIEPTAVVRRCSCTSTEFAWRQKIVGENRGEMSCSKRKPMFRNSFEIYEFPASLGVYRGVIISKTSKISKSNRAAKSRKFRFRSFGISKCYRSTSLCLPRAGSRGIEYAVPTSRLLQDPSLAHRQAMSNSRKHRGTWQRKFCGCDTFW